MQASRWLALAMVIGLAVPRAASAQTEDEAPASEDQEARAVFQAGQVAYDRGDFESALTYFQRAYELSDRAIMLINIAAAADRLRQDEVALAALERFVELEPDSPRRPQVEERIRILRSQQSPEEPVGSSAPPDSGSVSPVPWILVASGGALAVGGGVLFAIGLAENAAVDGAEEGSSFDDVRSAYANGPIFTGIGVAMFGVGVAALGVGLVWALTADSDEEQVEVGLGPAGVTMGGRW